MPGLNGKQLRYLRGLGHHLNPAVMIGKEEITQAVTASLEEALSAHELVKVKIQEGCGRDRHEIARLLADQTGAAVVQVLGRTVLLFRAGEKRKIDLP